MLILKFFNSHGTKSPILRALSLWISRPTGYIPLIIAMLIPVLILAPNKATWLILSAGVVGGSWLFAHILKIIFRIPRPVHGFEDILVLITESGYSFPSEHASVFSAIAVLGFYAAPWFGAIFLVLAVFVSISRVIAGVHYPSDVLVGFCLGTFVGMMLCSVGAQFL